MGEQPQSPQSPKTPGRLSQRRGSDVPPPEIYLARRRLSVMIGPADKKVYQLDGYDQEKAQEEPANPTPKVSEMKEKKLSIMRHAALSHVGYVPFNPLKVNQDRWKALDALAGNDNEAFFGVFDGHGSLGHEAAEWISEHLPMYIAKEIKDKEDPTNALIESFEQCQRDLAHSSVDCTFSGSTGVCVVVRGRRLWCCNAGDSRAVLATRGPDQHIAAVALSEDHKPDLPDERKRVVESGGRVAPCRGMDGNPIGPSRVWLGHQDIPGLAMTRSFGDLVAASVGVTASPDVRVHDLSDSDLFIILASDGVWEFISNEEAVQIVYNSQDPESGCRALVDESTKRWQKEEEVIDDITCLLIYLQ